MKSLITMTTALLLSTTAIAFAQTSPTNQGQQNLLTSPGTMNPNRASARRPAVTIERETTGMGLREPEAQFLFSPGAKDPQRNDPTVTPFGPMNNIGGD
jgi:hypothetical protein